MKKILFSLGVFILLISGCEKNEILSPGKQVSKVILNVSGLQNLGPTAWYEVWVAGSNSDGESIQTSAGVFTVSDQGVLSETDFNINLGYLQQGLYVFLTVEDDDLPDPSIYQIAASNIQANNGSFDIGHNVLLDFKFTQASGKYMLDTPTDTTVSPKSGLWFMQDTSATAGTNPPIAGLNLPKLPNTWVYRGWVNINGTTVPTGFFRNPLAGDKEGLFSGDRPNAPYPFPGEDFVKNAPAGLTFPTDLSGSEVSITIEGPHPAGANAPFILKVLSATIPGNAQSGVVYEMDNVLYDEEFMNSTMQIEVKLYE